MVILYKDYKTDDDIFKQMYSLCWNESHWKAVGRFRWNLKSCPNFFVAFDRLSLLQIKELIHLHSSKISFNEFIDFSFGTQNFEEFNSRLYRIVHLRNHAVHGGGIRIAIDIHDTKKNTRRNSSEQKKYLNVLNAMIDYQ